jgi:hypothetical protein
MFAIPDSPHIFEISEDDHPRTVRHARDHWWTLDFANAFVSPGVNSRGELVASHGASRRRLGENTRAQLECFISDKARTASVFNRLKHGPSYEFTGEVIIKINVSLSREN